MNGMIAERKPAKPGRPRSEQADNAIIDATLELFAERGVEGVCVEAVAARAGVGKATIYRRWSSKEDLLIAALSSVKSPLPQPRGESVRDDLIAMLHGEAANYPRLMQRYKETVIDPRQELFRQVLRRGVATGELRADLDPEIARLALTGAVMARGKAEPAQAEPGFAARVVDELLAGFASRRD